MNSPQADSYHDFEKRRKESNPTTLESLHPRGNKYYQLLRKSLDVTHTHHHPFKLPPGGL